MKNILVNKITIKYSATVLQAIKKLEKNSYQILFVLDKSKKFIGSLTDGDIRRFLLKKPDLNSKIDKAVNKNSFYLKHRINRESLNRLFLKNKIHQIPILNSDNNLIDVYFSDFFHKNKVFNTPVIIMAGGLGLRLGQLTKNCPKPMLPINGKPILEHILNKLKLSGFINIFISVNYLKDHIINYFGDGKKFGLKISYIFEKKPLGTAGSLRNIDGRLKTKDFIVMNGDILSSVNFPNLLNFHKKNKSFATMAVRDYEIQNKYGVVKTKGMEIIKFVEKPTIKNYINAGVYVLNSEIIKFIEENKKIDMPKLFLLAKRKKKLISAFPIYESWADIGSNDDYFDVINTDLE